MTVLDDLRVMEERIATRLAELEPLVQEYHELQQIAERLGIDRERLPAPTPAPADPPEPMPAAPAAAPSEPAAAGVEPVATKPKPKAKAMPKARARAKAAAKRRAPARRRAGAGSSVRRQPGGTQRAGAERRERMLSLIADRPGITVPELSEALSVDAPSLYRVVRKLQSDGTIAKDGKNLRLTGGSA